MAFCYIPSGDPLGMLPNLVAVFIAWSSGLNKTGFVSGFQVVALALGMVLYIVEQIPRVCLCGFLESLPTTDVLSDNASPDKYSPFWNMPGVGK